MRIIRMTKLLLFYFVIICGFTNVFGENVTVSKVKESVMETIFDIFYKLMEMSDHFERFPLNETYIDLLYEAAADTSQPPTNFNGRLLGVLLDYNVSHDCRHSVLQVNTALQKKADWAIRMIDAFGKPTTDLFDLKFRWLGSFDECITAHSHMSFLESKGFSTENITGGQGGVVGQYCTTTLPVPFSMVPESASRLVREWYPAVVLFGGCYPDTCSETDVSRIVKAVANHVQGSQTDMHVNVECQKRPELTPGAIFVIILLVVIGVALCIGTAYDVLHIRMKLFTKQKLFSSAEYEEHVHMNESEKSKAIVTSNGANGTLNGTNENYHVDNCENGATLLISRSVTEYTDEQEDAGADFEKSKLEIQLESEPDSAKKDKDKEPKSSLHILLMSFSVVKNAETLINTNVSGTRVNAIEGIRALTMGWIIVIHVLMFGAPHSDNVDHYVMDNASDFTFLVMTSSVCVDTFIVITGFLVAYLVLKKMPSLGGVKKFPWIHFYLCRIWRTSPTFYVVFLIYWLLWPNVSSGPMWEWGTPATNCSQLWWQTMLYFNNYYGIETNACFGGAWYLAVDLQLYIFSPIFIILFYLKPKAGLIVSGIAVLGSVLYCGIAAKLSQIDLPLIVGPANPSSVKFLLEYIHFYPFSHIAPFAIGMLTGYLVYKYRDIIKLTKWQITLGWVICLILFPLVTYGPIFPGPIDDRVRPYNDVNTFFVAINKSCWAIAVAWVIFACAIGKGGVVNKFLSWSPFIFLGRLTFSAYLIHVNVLHVYFYPQRTLFHLSDIELIFTGAGMIAMSFAAAFVLAVCVELPSYALPKIMLKDRKI